MASMTVLAPSRLGVEQRHERLERNRVRVRRSQLVDRLILAAEQQGAHHQNRRGYKVDGHDLQRYVFSRGPVLHSTERHQDQGGGGAAALDPSWKWKIERALDDGWPDDGVVETFLGGDDLFAQALRVSVSIDPPPTLGALPAQGDEPPREVARAPGLLVVTPAPGQAVTWPRTEPGRLSNLAHALPAVADLVGVAKA